MADLIAYLGVQHLLLFILAGWVLNLTPGPDVFYMVTHALKGGWRAGTVAAAGIFAGCLVHVLAATVGLSALVASSATAFTVIKLLGAAYLVYVGLKMLMSKSVKSIDAMDAINSVADEAVNTPAKAKNGTVFAQIDLKKVFLQGFWTNVLNPKVALFFLAFLPQFIAPNVAHPSLAFLALGILFNVSAVPVSMAYVLLAAWLGQRASLVQRSMHLLERAAGAVFMVFGVKLALTELPH
jgi:threonine/homoserine/homoserine lactone efflux protein